MYAPKFRHWMSSWDRFQEAQDSRIDSMADAALVEIHKLADEARAAFAPPPKPKDPTSIALEMAQQYMNAYPQGLASLGTGLQGLQQSLDLQRQQMAAMQNAGVLTGLGAGLEQYWEQYWNWPQQTLHDQVYGLYRRVP